MSDVSQGPGWWLASDGKWYPPHTAPQATLPPDAAASYPQYAASTTGTEPGTATAPEPYAGQGAGAPTAQPTAYGVPGYQPQAYQQGYGAGYAYPAAGAPTDVAPGAPVTTAAPGVAAPVTGPTAETMAPSFTTETGPAATSAPAASRLRWQPWLALAGMALVLWGIGQGLMAWAQWHAVQLTSTHVTQQHIGMALTAAGPIIAGVATIAVAMVLDKR